CRPPASSRLRHARFGLEVGPPRDLRMEPGVLAGPVEPADATVNRQVNEPPDAHSSLVWTCLACDPHTPTVTQHPARDNRRGKWLGGVWGLLGLLRFASHFSRCAEHPSQPARRGALRAHALTLQRRAVPASELGRRLVCAL